MNKNTHYQAFDEKWFEKNQRIILFVFRIIYKLFPSLLFKSQETKDFGNKKIVKVGTNYATCLVDREKRELKTVFFTDWNYSKMLYEAFEPMWWAMHWWDEIFADRLVPSLSFGFSTLTAYPDAHTETDTVDGGTVYYVNESTWATIHDGAGNYHDDSGTSFQNAALGAGLAGIYASATSGKWIGIWRGIATFKTSDLTAGATISATVLSLYGNAKTDGLSLSANCNFDVYTATPASNNDLVDGDYAQTGTTSQTGAPISYASWGTTGYNDFTFNATGRGNVSKTGISKFSCRNSTYDVANAAPSWTTNAKTSIGAYASDYGSNKPKLVVTYTLASGGGEAGLLLRNCQ